MKAKVLRKTSYYVEFEVKKPNGTVLDILGTKSKTDRYHYAPPSMYEKDGNNISDISPDSLDSFYFLDYYDNYRARNYPKITDQEIVRMISTMKEAKSKEFQEHYAFALFCEFVMGLTPAQKAKYFDECLPYFPIQNPPLDDSYMCSMSADLFDGLKKEEQRQAFAYTMCSCTNENMKLYFSITGNIVKAAMKYVSPHILQGEKGYETFLERYPLYDPETSDEGKALLKYYHGLGIDSHKLVSYYIRQGKADDLYQAIMKNNALLWGEAEINDSLNSYNYDLLDILRFLVLHGYEDKKKELARRFLPYTEINKNYQMLRVFVTDQELKDDIQNGVFDDIRQKSGVEEFEQNATIRKLELQRLAQKSSTGYYSNYRDLDCFRFAYLASIPYDTLDSYTLKDCRKAARQTDTYSPDIYNYFLGMAGLIRYHDKLCLRSLRDEASEPFEKSPFLCLLKELAKEECGKKDDDLHDYEGGK